MLKILSRITPKRTLRMCLTVILKKVDALSNTLNDKSF